jgi:hypothetical protein
MLTDPKENIRSKNPATRLIKKRDLLVMIGALISLPACSQSQVYPNLGRALRYVAKGVPDTPVDREAIKQSPYAFISGKIGRGPRSILVLWETDNNDLLWLSADSVAIVTRFGRVVKTAGLPQEIVHTSFVGNDPLFDVAWTGDSAFAQRSLDLQADNARTSLVVRSSLSNVGRETVSIEGIEFDTIRVREENTTVGTSWSFTNHFWVDPTDLIVWRSEQHISPAFPPIEIDTLKPST